MFEYKNRCKNCNLDQKRTRFQVTGHKYNISNFPYIATGLHFKSIILMINTHIYMNYKLISGPNVVPYLYNM